MGVNWSDKKSHTIVSLGSVGKILSSNKDGIAHTKYLNLEKDYNTAWYLNTDGSFASNSAYIDGKVGCLNIQTGDGEKKWPPEIEGCRSGRPTKWVSSDFGTLAGYGLSNTKYPPSYFLCANENGLYTGGGTIGDCRWIDHSEAVKCCTDETLSRFDIIRHCSPNYDPASNITACPVLMLDECVKDWTSTKCKAYLSSFKNQENARKTIQMAIRNYINSKDPPDFTPKKDDDDPFFTSTMPNLCQTVVGACDDILYQYCAQFTRENLNDSKTLQRLCGCHLSDGSTPPDAGLKLKNTTIQPNQYPYPGINIWCDPVCRFAGTIEEAYQSDGRWNPRECKSTTCIIDNVTVNEVNSCGGFNINMVCGGCKKETAGCSSCYISNVTANIINSCGKVNLEQNCGACYVFDQDNPAAAKKVNCGTLGPRPPGPPGPDGNWVDRLEKWFSRGNNKFYVAIGSILLIIIAIIVTIVITRKHKKSSVANEL